MDEKNPDGSLIAVGGPAKAGHGHLPGTGPNMQGQGPSIDVNGNPVPWNSSAAHWEIKE